MAVATVGSRARQEPSHAESNYRSQFESGREGKQVMMWSLLLSWFLCLVLQQSKTKSRHQRWGDVGLAGLLLGS